jgi:chromosome condensin MukBEF MukE localization factor
MEAWFYGKTKETNEEMVIKVAVAEEEKILEISVNSSNLATLTGLLAELRNKVKTELGKSRRIGKIGIVSEKNREDIICRTTSLLSKFAETELKADETEREI